MNDDFGGMGNKTYAMRSDGSAARVVMIGFGIALALGVLAVIVMVGWYFYGIGIKNSEVRARNQVLAQKDIVEAIHDKMWKVLAQKAGVADRYKPSDYKDMIREVVEGRKGGSFAKFVQENNPNYDLSLLRDLSQSIEAERAGLVTAERRLADLNREHRDIIGDYWKRGFLEPSQREPIEVVMITSTRSKGAARTGIDDSVDLVPASK